MSQSQPTDGQEPTHVAIIGAGPSGLTAALELSNRRIPTTVVEADHIVGGISRTESYKGYRFDMGGHRFFTKSKDVQAIWRDLLGADLLKRPRLSRIYYGRKFFDYPLKPWNAIRGLGLIEGARIIASFLRWQLFPHRPEETFEQWVTNRFGARLFNTFFRAYTEKVWGISCSELKADWAAQRIKDLSLRSVIANMLSTRHTRHTSLIEEFHYPRLGPGMMWAAAQQRVEADSGRVRLNSEVRRILRDGNRIVAIEIETNGASERIDADTFISSMPVTALVNRLDPPAPAEVRSAAEKLSYRSFLTVCLVVDAPELFPDNWIYIQDPDVTVGRIQNFKNWSPDMVPDSSKTSLGMEYFCNEGDALWSTPDAELIELGKQELERIGLGRAADVIDGCVFRVPKSYPVYDSEYAWHLATIRDFVARLENLETIGRNGLHRYNNQDHAMITGMLAAKNLVDGENNDLWSVNTEQQYHEALAADDADELDMRSAAKVLQNEFARIHPLAFGTALGVVSALSISLLTVVHILGTGPAPPLHLLAQFFPGYSVSITGSLVGGAYAAGVGLMFGWVYARMRNAAPRLWLHIQERRSELPLLERIFDYVDRRRP